MAREEFAGRSFCRADAFWVRWAWGRDEDRDPVASRLSPGRFAIVLFSLGRDTEGLPREPSVRELFSLAADRLRLDSVDRRLAGREFGAPRLVDRKVLGCEFAERA
jgi:hypothetical protein